MLREIAGRFLKGYTFHEPEAERRFLHHVGENHMLVDAGIFLACGVFMLYNAHASRTSQCADLSTSPCPLGFWVPRAAGAVWNLGVGLGLGLARCRPRKLATLLPRYQQVLFALLTVSFYLEIGQACLKEVYTRPEKRCSNSVTMCPNFNWHWIQVMVRSVMLYFALRCFSLTLRLSVRLSALVLAGMLLLSVPWYTEHDDAGRAYTVNNFEPGGVLLGFLYLLLVSVLALHCKALQERSSRRMFEKRQYLLSQQASISALLQKYIPSRFSQLGGTELVMEEFPMVTILFCSFDIKSFVKYTQQQDAQTFLSTIASAVLDFDLLLEATDLFKLENVGQDYIVTSSVVTFGISSNRPDTEHQRRADAAALVGMALEMLHITQENRRACAVDGHGALDIKVGIHSGACVGALAGAQRRFYRLFGDTVNTAARMCSHSEMGTVHLSAATNNLIANTELNTVHRGAIHIKGKGLMDTYKVMPENLASGSRILAREARVSMSAGPGSMMHRPSVTDGGEQRSRSAGNQAQSPARANATTTLLLRRAGSESTTGYNLYGGRFADPLCRSIRDDKSSRGADWDSNAAHGDESLALSSSSLQMEMADVHLAPSADDMDAQELASPFSACSDDRVEPYDTSGMAPSGINASVSCSTPFASTRWHRASTTGHGKERRSSLLRVSIQSLVRRQFIKSCSFRSIVGSDEIKEDVVEIFQEHAQLGMFTGEFKDAVKEAGYQAASMDSMKLEHNLLLRMLLVSTVYMHAYIYVTMSANHQFNMNHLWIWAIGAVAAGTHFVALWLMKSLRHYPGSHHNLFYAAYVLSMIMLVPLVLVTPTRFPMLGYLLLNFHSPTCSRSYAAAASVVFAGLLILAIPLWFFDGHEEGWTEMLSGSMPIVAVLLLTPAVCRAYFINSRLVWQADIELKAQRQKLAGMLYDLVPSVAACRFVLQQHQNILHLDERRLISRSTLLWAAPIGNVACVLTSDMVSFTVLSDKLGAMRVAQLLHDLWSIMDGVLNSVQASEREDDLALLETMFDSKLVKHAHLFETEISVEVRTVVQSNSFTTAPFKIDTLGDAYVVAVIFENPSEAQKALSVIRMLTLASDITKKVMEYSNTGPLGLEPGSLRLRMGLCIGLAVSGLVGLMKPRYHLVGEAIRVATELESKSSAFHVHLDEAACSSVGWLKSSPLVDVSSSDWYSYCYSSYINAQGPSAAGGSMSTGCDVAGLER